MSKIAAVPAPKTSAPTPAKTATQSPASAFDGQERSAEPREWWSGRDLGQMSAGAPNDQHRYGAGGVEPGGRSSESSRRPGWPVQRHSRDRGADPALAEMHGLAAVGVAGSGRKLPYHPYIQRAFGNHDLSGVRAHIGGSAARASRAINAKAYTMGEQIAFAEPPTLHTAAHEAAHVIQQRRGVSLPMGIGQAGDRYEEHANRVADRVVAGRSAADLLDQAPAASRQPTRLQRLELEPINIVNDKKTIIDGKDENGQSVYGEAFESNGAAAIISAHPIKGTTPSPPAKNISQAASKIFEQQLVAGHMLSQQLGGLGGQENITAFTRRGNTIHEQQVELHAKLATGADVAPSRKKKNITPSSILYVTGVTERRDFTRSPAQTGGNRAGGTGINLANKVKGGHAVIDRSGQLLSWTETELSNEVGPYGEFTAASNEKKGLNSYDTLKTEIIKRAQTVFQDSQGAGDAPSGGDGQAGQDSDMVVGNVEINPLVRFSFPRPKDFGEMTVSKPDVTHPGVAIEKATFTLKNKDRKNNKGLEFKSGSMKVAFSMGKLTELPTTRDVVLKTTKQVDSQTEFHASADSSQNEFSGIESKLDRLLPERVTTTGKLTDDGVAAEIKVSKGSLGNSGLVLQESTLSASMNEGGPSLEGSVGFSDEKEKITGRLELGWSGDGVTVAGSATVKEVITGLDPFTAKITYQDTADSPDALRLSVDKVAYKNNISGVGVSGEAKNLDYDFKTGALAGQAKLSADISPLGTVQAKAQIAENRLQRAEFTYDTGKNEFPEKNPIFSGSLNSKIVYEDDAITGRIGGTADLHLPGLKNLGQEKPIRLTVDAGIADSGAVSGTLTLVQPVQFSPFFKVTRMSAGLAEDGQISFTGGMALDSGVFNPAEVTIGYEKGTFSGSGTIGISKGAITGVDAASLTLTIGDDGISGSGTITPTLKQIKQGRIDASYSKEDGIAFGGGLTLGDIPYVTGASVDFRVGKRPGATAYDVRAAGDFTIAIPGLTAKGKANYENGAFTIEGTTYFERGMAAGTVTVGVTNRVVDQKGKIGTQIADHLTPYGKGELTVTLTSWLQGRAGVRLLPNGELIIDGGLALTKPITLFKKRELKKNILDIDIDIPIVGLTIPVIGTKVGIFATVGGGVDLDASVGPGQIKNTKLHVTYNPSRPKDTKISGSASLRVPAQAGVRLAIRGALGLGIPIVSASLGLEASGRMGLEGALDAGIDMAWSPNKGLSFDAFGKIAAQPKLRFDLTGFAKVEADVLVKTYELYNKRWRLASFEYGPDMRLGMKFPVHYDAQNGLQMAWSDVEFEKPSIDARQLLKGLVDKAT